MCVCVYVCVCNIHIVGCDVCMYISYYTHTHTQYTHTHTHTQVYSRLLESATSETSARMGAMENASKNCGEMIDKLTLDMNKARQAVITQELGEIVSGAAAVEDK